MTDKNKYPESVWRATPEARFTFKIYLKNGEKHYTDYYTRENAIKMQQILDAEKEVYTAQESVGEDLMYLEDVNL